MEMPRPRPLHLNYEPDHRGNPRWYFRIGKGKRTRIKHKYGSDEFNKAYQALLAGEEPPTPTKDVKNSVSWLINKYKHSSAWKDLAESTRKQRDTFLHQMNKSVGSKPYRSIKRSDIQKSVDNRRSTPTSANNFLKAMRHLFLWAEDALEHNTNPTVRIKKVPNKTDGHIPWSEDDIAKYRDYWEIGTKQRLAMEMLLWFGLRRSDIVRVGKQHFKKNVGSIRAKKNDVEVPMIITDYLHGVINATPTGDLTYLITDYGKPRSSNGFGNWFSASARSAGLTKRSAHGLRKTAAELLAEAGGTNEELDSYFGWISQNQSKEYVKKARRKKMAIRAATKRLEEEHLNSIPSHLDLVRAKTPKEQ